MHTHRKKIPIGVDRFKHLREEDFYYIDKTGMIQKLIYSWGSVNLFTRPRRFGKSLNLDMFQTFINLWQIIFQISLICDTAFVTILTK